MKMIGTTGNGILPCFAVMLQIQPRTARTKERGCFYAITRKMHMACACRFVVYAPLIYFVPLEVYCRIFVYRNDNSGLFDSFGSPLMG